MPLTKKRSGRASNLLPEGRPTSWLGEKKTENVSTTASHPNRIIVARSSPPSKNTTETDHPATKKTTNATSSSNPNPAKKSKRNPRPQQHTAFDRLYQSGKQQAERQKLRTELKNRFMPPDCTFAPITNTLSNAISTVKPKQYISELLSSIVGAVETIGGSGGLQSRDLLHAEFSSRMLEFKTERQIAARASTKRQANTFKTLYQDGQAKLVLKKKKEKEHQTKVPVNCTFKPMLSPRINKKIDETKTKYMARAVENVSKRRLTKTPSQMKGQGGGSKKAGTQKVKRTDLLYADQYIEREKRKKILQKKLVEDAKYVVKNPYASPKNIRGGPATNEGDTNVSKWSDRQRRRMSPRGVDADGRFIKYNKNTHRQQMEQIAYLKQKKECTFQPVTNSTASGEAVPIASTIKRLMQDGVKRNERKQQKLIKLPENCTFTPTINGAKKGSNADASRGAAASARLYTSGQKMMVQRKKKYKNRQRPTFRPDLSSTAVYNANLAKRPKTIVQPKLPTGPGPTNRQKKGGRSGGGRSGKNIKTAKPTAQSSYNMAVSDGEEEEEDNTDVKGLKGVSDKLEAALIEEAKELQPEDTNQTSLQAVADDADKSASVVCHAVAMYDFDGSNSGGRNISFKAGAIIEVTEMGE